MKIRRSPLKVTVSVLGLLLIIAALLFGTYKFAENRTENRVAAGTEKNAQAREKESYRKGYTYGYVEGHTNGYVRGVNADGDSKIECEVEYGGGIYADVECYGNFNGERGFIGWVWPEESYVGPGPDGVPATSGPNAPKAK